MASPGFYTQKFVKHDGKIGEGEGGTPTPFHVTYLSLVIQPITRDLFSLKNQATRPSHFILHSKQASRQVKKKEEKKVKQNVYDKRVIDPSKMPRYYLIQLVRKPQDQLTKQERDELNLMKRNIYKDTIQQNKELFPHWYQDVKEQTEDLILALQQRVIPALCQALQTVPGLSMICDQTGLLDEEPTL